MGSTSTRKGRLGYALAAATALALAVTVGTLSRDHSAAAGGAAGAAQLTAAEAATATAGKTQQGAVYLVASLEGRNEVPVAGKPPVGDPHGQAVEVIRVRGDKLSYAVRWRGIGEPTEAHLHIGVRGVNGAVAVPLFTTPRPQGTDWATGTVTVTDSRLLEALSENPGGVYANLHTSRFPGGALRGQLHRLDHAVALRRDAVFQASVVHGVQIYACTRQSDDGYAFAQDNVAALLEGGIRHSFVRAQVGPPQWRAVDGSAVTGTVLSKTPDAAGNVPELDLRATQSGARRGLLSRAEEILRLNTVGGAAPTGSCDPAAAPTLAVPYQADYVFVN